MTEIHLESWVRAERHAVFQAITTREGLDGWWGRALEAEARVGAVLVFDHGLGDLLRMEVVDLEAPDRVVWRCLSDFSEPSNPASEWLGTTISFELRAGQEDPAAEWLGSKIGIDATADEFTIVDFHHGGWPAPSRWRPFCDWAWGQVLTDLGGYCQPGRPVERQV